MRSKAYHAFTQKLSYFDDDIELMDVLYKSVTAGDLTDQASQHILKRVDPVQHTHIARRKNADGSRKIVITHLRSTIYSSYVKDIYEEVTHYLRTVLAQASKNGFNSGRLIGEHSFKIDAKSILALGDWNQVCQLVTDSVFQSLEAEKSTLKLLEKMANKLALNIDANLIAAALPYLEARHFLVHTDGKASEDYTTAYPQIQINNGYIALNFQFISNLRSTVKALVAEYDKEVIAGNLLKAEDTQP
jgi:hypothetical protein